MIHTINLIAEEWFTWQTSMLWQVALLIAIVAAVDLLIRKWAWPQVRYALWLLILVKLVLPPTLTLSTSLTARIGAFVEKTVKVQLVRPPAATPPAPALIQYRPEPVFNAYAPVEPVPINPPTLTESPTPPAITSHTAPLTATAIAPEPPGLSLKVYALLAWLGGVVVLAGWLTGRLRRFRREHLNNYENNALPGRFCAALEQTAAQLKLKKLPRVILTDKVKGPAVFGIFRPILLMPADKVAHMASRDIEHILLHELAHIKRGDLFVHAVSMILQIAYWFNPLIWLTRKPLQSLRELCCDATVAKILKDKTSDYRETLLETARQLLAEPVTAGMGLLGLFENSHRLLDRLKWLEKKTWKNRPLRIALIVALVGVMGFCILPMAKAQNITHHARKVMKLANRKAHELNHAYIGTEHILLALIGDDKGVAARILKNLDIDTADVPVEIGKLVKSGSATVKKRRLPQTPRAKKVMPFAEEAAVSLKHEYVSTEHILLGVMRVKDGVGAQVLANLGAEYADVRRQVLKLVGPGPIKGGHPTLVISGIVKDAATGLPIAGAKVDDDGYADGKRSTTTESDGTYAYLTWPEHHSIKAEAPGYKTQRETLYKGHFDLKKETVEQVFNFDLTPQKAASNNSGGDSKRYQNITFKEVDGKIELRLNLERGQVFRYRFDSLSVIKGKDYSHEDRWVKEYRFEVLESHPTDGYDVRLTVDRAYRKIESPGESWSITPGGNFDDISSGAADALLHAYITDHPVIYKISNHGEIVKILNEEEFIAGFSKFRTDPEFIETLKRFSPANWLKGMPALAIWPLPKTPIAVNDTWKIQIDKETITNKLIGIDGKTAILNMPVESNENKTTTIIGNTIRLDITTGLIVDMTLENVESRPENNVTETHTTKSTRISTPDKSNFTATLPNGVTVELLGVCDIPADGKRWWAADGSPVENVYWDGTSHTIEEKEKARQVILRINSNETDPDLKPTINLSVHSNLVGDGAGSWSGAFAVHKAKSNQTLEELCGCSFSLHDDHPTVDISATIGYGPWKTQTTKNANSYGSLMSAITTIGTVIVNDPTEKEGETTISATIFKRVKVWRFVAVDKQGKIHNSRSGFSIGFDEDAGANTPEHQLCTAKFSLPLSQIEKFQFQTRETKTVEFKNVSLRPGGKTDVQIEVEKATSNKSGGVGIQDSSLGENTSAEAAFIIQKVLDRYAAIKTYSAIGELLTDVDGALEAMGVIPGMTTEMLQMVGKQQLKSIFTIKMARPNLYCIEWNENIDTGLSKVGNAWSVGDGSYGLILGKEKSFEKPLRALIGTAGNMGRVQSSLFFDTSLNTLRELRDLSQQQDGQLEGVDCYVISGNRHRVTYTYWVSKKDFLILQHKSVSGGDGKPVEGDGPELTDEVIKMSLKAMDKEATPKEIANMKAMLATANEIASNVKVTNTETYRNIILDQPISKEQFVPSKDIDEITEELKKLRAQYINRLKNISPTELNFKTDVEIETKQEVDDNSDWKELVLPDMDSSDSPAMLALDTHELVAIHLDNDQASDAKWIRQMQQTPDRFYLFYEEASNKTGFIIGTAPAIFHFGRIDGERSVPPKPVFQFFSKTLPDTFSMTAPDGQVYEFTVLQADSKSCRLRYRLHPGVKTDIQVVPVISPYAMFKHKRRVKDMILSPDGLTLFSESAGSGVWVTDTRTGKKLRTLLGSWVNSMAVSHDGGMLAIGTNRGTVEIWSLRTFEREKVFQVTEWSVYAVALSADGSVLASCAADGTVQVWDVAGAKRLMTLGQKGDRMCSMSFSPDGKVLATGTRYGRADVWNLADSRLLGSLDTIGMDNISVYFCKDANTLAIAHPLKVLFWEYRTGNEARAIKLPDSINPLMRDLNGTMPESRFVHIGKTILSADCATAAWVADDGTIVLWDVRTRGILAKLAGDRVDDLFGGGVDSMVFSSDKKLFAAGNRNGNVELWKLSGIPGGTIEAVEHDIRQPEDNKVEATNPRSPATKRVSYALDRIERP